MNSSAQDKILIIEAAIPQARADAFARRIEDVNRRAARFGASPIILSFRACAPMEVERVRKVYDAASGGWNAITERVRVPGVQAIIEGYAPRIPGWRLAGHANIKEAYFRAGTREIVGMTTTVFLGTTTNDVKATVASRLTAKGGLRCEHCDTVRNRKEAFVLERTDGSVQRMVVGSTCVSDFTGHDPKALLAAYRTLLSAYQEIERDLRVYRVEERYEWESFFAAEHASEIPLEEFLALAYEDAQERGFIPADQADDVPTYRAAFSAVREGRKPQPEALKVAREIIAFLPQMGFREDDLWKARRLGDRVNLDEAELAARCIIAWCQQKERPLRGEFLAAPGEWLELDLTVTGTSYLGEDDWGNHLRMIRFATPDDRRVLWRTRSAASLQKGDVIHCRARIKNLVISQRGNAVTEFGRVTRLRHCPPEPQNEGTLEHGTNDPADHDGAGRSP